MAQILEEYERLVEPRVPKEVSDEFKPIVRRKVSALGADCKELLGLENDAMAMNGVAQALRDQVEPDSSARVSSLTRHVAEGS